MISTSDTYDPAREITPEFIGRVTQWIDRHGEVFVILRYLRAGGSKDFLFCRSPSEFVKLVETLPIGTDTIVFENRQLPFRGLCSEPFIEDVLSRIPEGVEYLVAHLHPKEPRNMHVSGSMGDTHACLSEDLRDFMGEEVAVGLCPNFNADDHETMISASKGGIDGPR